MLSAELCLYGHAVAEPLKLSEQDKKSLEQTVLLLYYNNLKLCGTPSGGVASLSRLWHSSWREYGEGLYLPIQSN